MKQTLKDELDRLEALNIIGKVSEPTDWVNAMFMVEKKDRSVRLCIDPVDLNKAIRRPHYPIPTFEDATEDLHGISIVSKVDVQSGYWILLLTERSSFYTTLSTVFGRYRWKRYPFGLLSVQDEFQRQMDEIFEGFEGIRILVDDILVYGKSQEEHDNRLWQSLNTPVRKDSRRVDLKVDASKQGLGAEISTNGNICGYTSRALSKTEKNYSQLKKEMYAMVYGLKHFHHYIYGRKVTVTTDSRPLETILSKPLHQVQTRLQRMMIQILPYDLEVIYSPGSNIPVADALSQLHLPDTDL
ncbi:hypothetical protein QYM36_004222 [Artemia franciscana]|uniref:Uncharacterized protein n=1 Tax=Artemia franciscana TaxID=6661 RepID=A0AA88I4Y4_ARTSF|nr:hypothetical protein QYM36_004222 [Artemia franciscana]